MKQAHKTVEETFTLRDALEIFLDHWKWFLLSVILCLGLARLYIASRPNLYRRQAVMLVKDDSGVGGRRATGGLDALMQLNGVLGGTSIKNEVYILRSFQLMQEVVKNLHLDVTYTYKTRLKPISLYNERPVTVQFLSDYAEPLAFRLEFHNAQECTISEVRYGLKLQEQQFTRRVRIGQQVDTPYGQFVILPVEARLEPFIGHSITVRRLSIEDAAIVACSKITSSEMDKESTLVRLTCTDSNIQRADDILNGILEAYKRSIIEDKNQMAQGTADFIDERIELISQELSQIEGQLAHFKQQTGLVDPKSNADAWLNQSSAARQRTVQVETQCEVVRYLHDYIRQNSGEHSLIPTLGGVSDPGIQTQISQFNQLMLERNKLAGNASEQSPAVAELDGTLTQMRAAILASIQGFLSSLEVQLQRAQREESGLRSTLTAVPEKERQVLDIARQQGIKSTLYTYLLNKREETALQLAITEANIRVVERPFGNRFPVAPRRAVISLFALIMSLVLPYFYYRVKGLLNMGVRGRKDIEALTTIPVLGEVPHRKDGLGDADIIVAHQADDPICEAFRMLRFSMNFMGRDARVIMFTSTMPGEGKTFISRNFAATLGMTGKKVVLMDTDIRKRTQSKLSSMSRHQGLTSYLSGAVDDVSQLVVTENAQCNLDFMPAGVTPPNPAELLMSDRLESCLTELKKRYDYIIIDNVPAQVVADAGIVNRVADLTIYVIREGKVDRRFLPELEQLHQEGKFNNLCIVINDATMEKKRYGYGYGYGEPQKRSLWDKLRGRGKRR